MDTEWNEEYDLWVRPNSWDIPIASEQRNYEPLGDLQGLRVLDLGANIGAFARWALGHGAASVVCVEPEPNNCRMIQKNVPRCLLVQAAIADTPPQIRDDGKTYLMVNQDVNKGMHTLLTPPNRTWKRTPVSFLSLASVLNYRVQILKVDIESSEYLVDWSPLEYCTVKRFVIEYHVEGRLRMAMELHRKFLAMGFTTLQDFDFAQHPHQILAFYGRT